LPENDEKDCNRADDRRYLKPFAVVQRWWLSVVELGWGYRHLVDMLYYLGTPAKTKSPRKRGATVARLNVLANAA
jgi:hypothetical protein